MFLIYYFLSYVLPYVTILNKIIGSIRFQFYPENCIVFLTGNTITKSTKSYIVGNFSNIRNYPKVCPNLYICLSIYLDSHPLDGDLVIIGSNGEVQFYTEVCPAFYLQCTLCALKFVGDL